MNELNKEENISLNNSLNSNSSSNSLINIKNTSNSIYSYGYRLLEYVKDDYLYILFGITALTTNAITNLSHPWIIGQAVDKASKGQSQTQLKVFLITSSSILLIGSLASWVRIYCLDSANYRIMTRMKKALYQNYLQQDIEFFDESQSGELITILDKDIEQAAQLYTDVLPSALRSLNSAINGSILLYLNSPKLCGITLLSVPLIGVGAVFISILSSEKSSKLREYYSKNLSRTIERLTNISTIKINNKESYELKLYNENLSSSLQLAQSLFQIQGTFMSYLNLTTNASLILILYFGGSMLRSNEMTSGSLTTFAIQTGFVGLGFSGLSSSYREFKQCLMACQRFYQTIDEKVTRQNQKNLTVDTIESKNEDDFFSRNSNKTHYSTPTTVLSIDNVSYAYPTRPNQIVIKNISLNFQKDSIHVIIGKSGSGKSTFLSLLCGLYKPTHGQIQILNNNNNIDNQTLSLDWVHKNVGVVEQSAKLFSGTIYENIAYGAQSEVTQQEVEEVAKLVNAHDFITKFPDGYKTEVGEGGQLLSGGQRTRIALARALIKNPELLILDEPSAALDTESEQILIQLLLKFKKNKSVILFTHSDEMMTIGDQLHLLDDGKIITSGTYNELMKDCQSEREIAILRAVSSSESLKSPLAGNFSTFNRK